MLSFSLNSKEEHYKSTEKNSQIKPSVINIYMSWENNESILEVAPRPSNTLTKSLQKEEKRVTLLNKRQNKALLDERLQEKKLLINKKLTSALGRWILHQKKWR